MLTRSLHELAFGTLFSSQQVNSALLAYLRADPTKIDSMSIDDLIKTCRMKLVQELDHDQARRFRLNDMEQVFNGLWGEQLFSSGDLPVMDELFARLMVRNGDYLQYQPVQVQAYARLAAEIDPCLLAGWHLAGWLRQSTPLPDDAARIINHQLPFFAPPTNSNKPHAEGHVHMGGVRFDLLVLGETLFHAKGMADEDQKTFSRLRRLMGTLLGVENRSKDSPTSFSRMALSNACTDQVEPFDNRSPDWQTLRDTCILRAGVVDATWLRWQFAQTVMNGQLARAWLWLVVYGWFLYRNKDNLPDVRVAVFHLFASLTQIRRRLIMDGQGLSRFVTQYSNAPLRKKREGQGADVMRELMADAADAAEIKIAPNFFGPDITKDIAQAAIAEFALPVPFFNWMAPAPELGRSELAYLAQLEQWHFCAHFLRRKEDQNTRENLWISAAQLQDVLSNQSGWNVDAFLGGHSNHAFHFQPAHWLRGLDIAGDENLIRNDVFAPVLRWLRRGFLPRDPLTHNARAASNFHLSIHVGEDYPHPLSGMRHIDETVRFCELRTGDRLGHALAIGIEPARWVARQGDMVLPADEHLDNLVWAWHYACELSARLPLANQVIPLLERRIARFANCIPWVTGQFPRPLLWPCELENPPVAVQQSSARFHIEPNTLHQAWLLRRNCYLQYRNNNLMAIPCDMLDVAVPDYQRLKDEEDTTTVPASVQTSCRRSAERIYLDREQNRLGLLKCLRCVLVRVADAKDWARRDNATSDERTFLYDFETPEELQFMHALQDYLLDQYDRQGLIIETNPSSNVYIARLENHAEHPIFRWNPPDDGTLSSGNIHNQFGLRRGPIQVLVNTDDPGIMPTTLRTEFALLQEAAIDLGISRTVAQVWLERLRQFGMDEFKGKHQNIFREIKR